MAAGSGHEFCPPRLCRCRCPRRCPGQGQLNAFSAARYDTAHHIAPHDDRAYTPVRLDTGGCTHACLLQSRRGSKLGAARLKPAQCAPWEVEGGGFSMPEGKGKQKRGWVGPLAGLQTLKAPSAKPGTPCAPLLPAQTRMQGR